MTDPDDEASAGSAKLHLGEDGTLYLHQTVTWPVEVYQPEDVPTRVGVDLNDDPLACAAVVSNDDVEAVEWSPGGNTGTIESV